MSSYNFDLESGKTLTLQTAGKYCDRDIVVNAIGGGVDISDSTVTAETLPLGEIAYNAEGERIVGRFPAEKLNYIRGTGTQRIDTGFKPNGNTRVVMVLENTPSSANSFIFGARTAASEDTFGFSNYTNGKYRVHYNNSYDDFNPSPTFDGKFTVDMNKNVVTLSDGVDTYTYETTYASFQVNYNMWLFDVNNKNSSAGEAVMNLWSCQIYDNGTLVRDFVPYKIIGVNGLYDKVECKFYENDGTGSFLGA